MTEAEARERLIRAMVPDKVCQTCGEPSRRINTAGTEGIGTLIRQAREAAGLSRAELHRAVRGDEPNGLVYRWEADDAYPIPRDWDRLKTVLGLGDRFDYLVPNRDAVTYSNRDGETVPALKWESGIPKGKGAHSDKPGSLTRVAPDRFTACGHDNYRPGVWLDPFAD